MTASTTVLVTLADQRRSRTDSHGIIDFSLGLAGALPTAMRGDERLVVLASHEVAPELDRRALRAHDEVRVVPAPGSTLARLRQDHAGVSALAREVGADVVVHPKGFLPLRSSAAVVRVVCLHDDIPARLRRDTALPLRRRVRAAYFETLLRRSVRSADVRLFVSAFTADALAPDRRPTDRVVGEGIPLPDRPPRALAERDGRVVVFGSTFPHKRTAAALDLIGGDPTLTAAVDRVTVVGALEPDRAHAGPLPVEHRTGVQSPAQLADLLAQCRLLVAPSAYEGFGLPPVEALALGTPVVFRRNGAAREVLAGVPGGYDREDGDEFARAVAEALALDDAALAALRDETRRRWDWSDVAGRAMEAIRDGLAGQRRSSYS